MLLLPGQVDRPTRSNGETTVDYCFRQKRKRKMKIYICFLAAGNLHLKSETVQNGRRGKHHIVSNKQPVTPNEHNDKIDRANIYSNAAHSDIRKERSHQCKTMVEKVRPINQMTREIDFLKVTTPKSTSTI